DPRDAAVQLHHQLRRDALLREPAAEALAAATCKRACLAHEYARHRHHRRPHGGLGAAVLSDHDKVLKGSSQIRCRKGEVIGMAVTTGGILDSIYRALAANPPASAREVAERAVLSLNASMMNLYNDSLATFKQNMRERVPIIVALFSGQGGQMILYPPG